MCGGYAEDGYVGLKNLVVTGGVGPVGGAGAGGSGGVTGYGGQRGGRRLVGN